MADTTAASADDTSESGSESTGAPPLGCGNGIFAAGELPYVAVEQIGEWGTITDVVLADLDDDGVADLLVSDVGAAPPTVRVLMGQGDGSLGIATNLAGEHHAYALEVGAIADGTPDLVAFVRPNNATTGSVLRSWRGDGSGSFLAHADQPITSSGEDVTLGDLDGDMRLDAITSASTAVDVLLATAAEGFETATAHPSPWVYAVTTGDVDGDAALDVLAATSAGLYVYRGAGDGTLEDPTVYGTHPGAGVGSGDFNGDGHLDVAMGGEAVVEVYLGDGAGGLQGPQQLTVQGPVNALVTPDLDDDGCNDIVVASGTGSTGTIGVVMSLGEDAFAFEEAFATAAFEGCPTSIDASDLDGDGIEDIVVGTSCVALVGRALALFSGG